MGLKVFNKKGELKVTPGVGGGGGSSVWGGITGTVTDQTDLVTYVTGLPVSTFTNDANYIVIGAVTSLPVSTFTNDAGYLTSAPVITLTGNVTGTGSGSFATTIASGVIVNSMISGSAAINQSKIALTGALSTIAGLSPTNDDFMQYKLGAWANRTISQVKSDLGISGTNTGDQTITLTGDVSGTGSGSFVTTIGASKIVDSMVATGINATKIASGNVSNTEFDYLDGVTSSIQSQINIREIGNCVHLASDFTTSSTSSTDTNLGFTATANKSYVVRIQGWENKITTATGVKMQISAPVGATITGNWFRGVTATGSSLQNEELSSINTLTSGVFGNAANTRFYFKCEFTITLGVTGGTVALGAATVTSNTATIFAGSSLKWCESTAV